MRKITITQGLVELKLYDKKISDAIREMSSVGVKKKASSLVGHMSADKFAKNILAGYQSVTDMIRNRAELKAAIVNSNAVTMVTVNGEQMTVAQAIERKTSIAYEQQLLNKIMGEYAAATATIQRENSKVDDKVADLLKTLIGKDAAKKITEEDQKAIEEPYRKNNEYELVDPLDVQEKIKELRDKIDGFISNVDTALVVSNSTTFIELSA